jgi:ferrochelatase
MQELLQKKVDTPVELAMSYGNPSIAHAVRTLLDKQIDELFLIPLYPHYAMSTYETVVVAVESAISKAGAPIPLIVQPPFYNYPLYIQALAASAKDQLGKDYDHLLFSYHGLPERHLRKTDPTGSHCLGSKDCCSISSVAHKTCYRTQVMATTEAMVQAASIPKDKYSVAFQSRLGRDKWLEPSTVNVLAELAGQGTRKLLVICPAFVSDCLETLEEIGIRGRETFLAAGGEHLELIPCLNDHPLWIDALKQMCCD